jgi:DNA-binding CsgD family transcriptional regulator/tetratricopeptide (TPR) repeat protein
LSPASDLLEREGEVAQLGALVEAARGGAGRFVLVEGGVGIGKTRLLAAVREQGREAGMRVLHARGGEFEREFAHGIVRQLFEPVLAGVEEGERDEILSGAAALAAPLFAGDYLAGVVSRKPESVFATLHGLFWLTANVAARRPLLLAVDDLHWADKPSVRWLAYLVRRLEGLPVLVVACLRPAESGGEDRMLAEVVSDPSAFVVRPPPLSEAAVTLLVREALSAEADAEFCAACFAATGGNPLFVRELVSALAEQGIPPTAEQAARVREIGPQGVVRSVRLRLSRLSPEAELLARAVAILGDDVELHAAAALAALDQRGAADAAATLGRADILRPELPLAFVHPVVRAAIYNGFAPAERERDHAKAAEILAERGAAAEQVAAQLLLTSPRGDALVVAALREAAHHALAQRAPDNAIAYLRRAFEEPPPTEEQADVLYQLGSAERLALDPAASRHLREALDSTDDPHIRGQTALELGRMLFFEKGRGEEAVDVLERAISGLPSGDSDLRQRLEAGLLTIALEEPPLYPRARDRLERLRANPPDDSVGGRILLAALAYHDARAGASLSECLDRAERAQSGGLVYGDEAGMGWCHVGFVLAAADHFDAALAVYNEALADARARGSAFAFALAFLLRGDVAHLRGSLSDAEADLRLAIEAGESHGLGIGLLTPMAMLADTLMDRGELAAAADALERIAPSEELPETVHLLSFRESRARLRIMQGRTREGLAELLGLGRRYEALGGRNPAMIAWRSQAALASLELGERDEARRLAAEEVELARQWGAPRALGNSLRAAGLVEGGERGLALLREATDVLEESPALLARARALTDLGAALRRANRRAAARDPLRRGLELAHSCGAKPLAERAHTELVATGARPRRLVLTGVDSLTPSERRVAGMAADGMTNRDIAQALFVTPRTVEVHLSSVYRKLAISSRSQLPQALTMPVEAQSGSEPAAVATP